MKKLGANKGDAGVQLMSFSLHKVNQLECSRPKQETNFHLIQLYYWSSLKNSYFMNIGELLTHKIPSVNTNPFSNVNPANRVFSFQQIKVQKVIQLPNEIYQCTQVNYSCLLHGTLTVL